MIVSLLAWTCVAMVGAVALARPIRVLAGLVEWEGSGRKLTIGDPRSLAVAGSIGVLALSVWGGAGGLMLLGGGLAGGPAEVGEYGPPNAPNITGVAQIVDSATLRIALDPFSGSLDDTHDSTRIRVYNATDSSLLVDSVTAAAQEVDTVSYAFEHDSIYNVYAIYYAANGGASDSSAVWQHTHSLLPAQITTQAVVAQTTTTLTFQHVTVHNGHGAIAFHACRMKNVTGDTASFVWWQTQESASETFDSLGTNVGDTASVEVTSLISGDTYARGCKTYRGEPNVDAVYGPTSNVAEGTTVSTPAQDTTDTPSITSASSPDSSTVNLNGSGFVGGSQTHDSTKWEVSHYSGAFSALIDSTSAAAKTSVTIASNTIFKADSIYAGRVTYYGSADASAVSDTAAFTMPGADPPPGGHPNEPGGFTERATHPFTTLVPSGWNIFNNDASSHPNGEDATIETDAGEPIFSNSSIGSANYTSSYTGGGRLFLLSVSNSAFNSDEFYIHFSIKYSSNWTSHSSGVNKIFFITDDDTGGSSPYYFSGQGGSLSFQVRQQGPVGSRNFTANVGPSANLTRGSWHDIEVYLKVNTIGQANGIVRVWVNGSKTHEYTDAEPATAGAGSSGNLNRFKWDPIWGGTGGNPPEQEQQIGHIYISTN